MTRIQELLSLYYWSNVVTLTGVNQIKPLY